MASDSKACETLLEHPLLEGLQGRSALSWEEKLPKEDEDMEKFWS